MKFSRRVGLAALGSAIFSPFLGLMERAAFARERAGAPCLVGVYMPHGIAQPYFRPGPGFELNFPDSVLAPFDSAAQFGRSFKDQILVIEGLDLTAGMEGGTTGHDGSRVILTGTAADGKSASLDQFLAVEHGLGQNTPQRSLVIGVGASSTSLGWCISYARGGLPLPKIINPTQTFHQVFGRFLAGEGPEAEAALARKRALGQSSLDYLRADLARLAGRLGASEAQKLDQHLTALRDLEKRLAPLDRICAIPAKPDARNFPQVEAYGGGEPYFEYITNLQVDLLAQALACDITRFSTLFLSDLSRTKYDPELPEDVHTEVAHRYAAPGTVTTSEAERVRRLLAKQNRYCFSKVARLMQRLAELGVLDRTLIYATSDMGDTARHSSRAVPTLLAGNVAGRFKMGRYLDASGTPNNRLLVSIAQAFGVEIEAFGESPNPATITGSLAGLS